MPNPSGNSGVILSSDLTFITNEQGQHLGDRFGVLLGDDTRFFDCLVGYFFISGFHRLHPALTKTEKIRILIGIKTDGATYELIQTAKKQQEFVLESHAQVRERVPGEILAEFQKPGDSSTLLGQWPNAEIRRRMRNMPRATVRPVWLDALGSDMNDELGNQQLLDCLIELFVRMERENRRSNLIQNLCAEFPNIAQ